MLCKRVYEPVSCILQYELIFIERMRHQLIWNRTINTTGRIGRNISMDLHIEHLKRDLKSAISHLSSNVTETNIDRLGKSLRKLLYYVPTEFDRKWKQLRGI